MTPRKAEPAIIDEWMQLENPRVGLRSLKMLRPVCRICERSRNRKEWWTRCKHDPYVTHSEVPTTEPVREPRDDGRTEQVGTRTFVAYVPIPNATEISLSMKVNSGKGVDWAKRKGFIHPSDLRSPDFPNGIAEPCQMAGCFEQRGLKAYGPSGQWGTYCRALEAALNRFYEDASGRRTLLEVGIDQTAMNVRDQQLLDALANRKSIYDSHDMPKGADEKLSEEPVAVA